MKLKEYCAKNGISPNEAITLLVGEGGGLLPKGKGFEQYFAVITERALICNSERLGVKVEVPFSEFHYAEFGIGAAKLWLQCTVGEREVVFALPKNEWKGETGQLLMQRIEQYTELLDKNEYDRYTTRSMFFNMWK